MSRKYRKSEKFFIKKFDNHIEDPSEKSFYKGQFDHYYNKYIKKLKYTNFNSELEKIILNENIKGGSAYVNAISVALTSALVTIPTTVIINYMMKKDVNILCMAGVMYILIVVICFIMYGVLKNDDQHWSYVALKALEKAEEDNLQGNNI